MAYLVYHKDMFGIHPAIIHDEAMYEYQKRNRVLIQIALTEEETKLTINELMQRYPLTENPYED